MLQLAAASEVDAIAFVGPEIACPGAVKSDNTVVVTVDTESPVSDNY